jgi:hypothetical protein
VLECVSYLQDRFALDLEDAAQGTMVAIMERQLDIQSEIATFQAIGVETGPTATDAAQEMASLVSTLEALKTERSGLEATLTSDTLPPVSLPTPTPKPTETSQPTRTPIRELVIAHHPISLGAVANASLDFLSPPRGSITLNGVPFQLSDMVFKSQASPSPDNSYPTSVLLLMDVPRACRVHLLLNTGNGFRQFNGKSIGQVVAHCNGTSLTVTDLQLGRDVCEWHAAHNVVSGASRAQQVWSGTIADFPDLTGHIDMLSLDLPNACRSGRLTALEVIDSSTSTVDSLDPALNLIGITVEHYQ